MIILMMCDLRCNLANQKDMSFVTPFSKMLFEF